MLEEQTLTVDLDIAIVQIAMMIAGLDGNVSPEEYVAFEDTLKFCGCPSQQVEEAFEKGLEVAGYIVLQSQRLPIDELIRAFVCRAGRTLPEGFKSLYGKNLRKAFMMWTIMAMSDNKYLDVERRGILALKDAFNKCSEICNGKKSKVVAPITDSFLAKCETLAAKLLSAQGICAHHPTIVNKNKCASITRRIKAFVEV